MINKKEQGFTLVEAILATVIFVLVILGLVRFIPDVAVYFHRTQVRNQASTDARICMDMITRSLSTALPSTVQIRTNTTVTDGSGVHPIPLVPNDQISFSTAPPTADGLPAGNQFTILLWLGNQISYNVSYPPNYTTWTATSLGHNVSVLTFTVNAQDPASVYVTLRIDAPWDQSGNPSHVETVFMPNQRVRLGT